MGGILRKLIFTIAMIIAAAPIGVKADICNGTVFSGPWFEVRIPDGMRVSEKTTRSISADTLWIENGEDREKIEFFLFSPQHGGRAYHSFLGASKVTRFVRADDGTSSLQVYSVSYSDGSTGLYEGNDQRVTGIRVWDRPLGLREKIDFDCFTKSIESFTN